MKRALAERAKQSGLPNGVVTASPLPKEPLTITKSANTLSAPSLELSNHGMIPNLPAVQQPPPVQPLSQTQDSQKAQKPRDLSEVEIPVPAFNRNETTTSLTSNSAPGAAANRSPRIPSSPSPRPKKRLREFNTNSSNVKLLEEEDQEDSNASAFYLRHQNRALASELRSVKYQLVRLERERDYRRAQCSQAVESLNALEAIWTQLETSFCNVGSSTDGSDIGPEMIGSKDSAAPLSTGSGTSVEMIGALLNSLDRLRVTRWKSRIKNDGDVGGQVDASNESQRMNGNSKVGSDSDRINVDKDVTSEGNVCDEPMNTEAVIKEEPEHDDSEEQRLMSYDIAEFSDTITQRAAALQSWIVSLLHKIEQSNSDPDGDDHDPPRPTYAALQEELARLHARNTTLQEHLEELARSRDEMVESDRRVRRGLYRLAAGRMPLKDVLKDVSGADEDKEAAAAWMESAVSSALPSSASSLSVNKLVAEKGKAEIDHLASHTPPTVSLEEATQLKKQVAELNEVASSRDEQIKKLLAEREEQLKRISALVLKDDKDSTDIPTNLEVQRSDLYLELTSKLAASERKLEEVEKTSNRIKEEWSTALANAELSKKAMEELQSKHLKRWAELAEENPDIGPAEESVDNTSSRKTSAEEIVTLQHKLTQALENVRQAETTRKTLDEAIALNDSLQAKVEEFKSKYNALQVEKAARFGTTGNASNNNGSNANNAASSSADASTAKTKASPASTSAPSSSISSEKIDRSAEKLLRDYKRARKELAAATASKEAAKAKLERTEKDRDFLNQMNSRLLKQAAEKDEINAKSLSTILHLKQLTEQISKEKENLEQQVKSAEQLALAARLASNARERITEEFEKERAILEGQVREWENRCSYLAREKELAEGRLSQEKAKMSGLINDAQKAKERCDELASESTKLQEEKQRMIELLAVAQREASDAASLSQRIAESSGVGMIGGFTAEQLSTQVSVLKSRLACPVCNARDKKCILLRCRHMFCKSCVDENIKNRSRKCPACGTRFDTKDVADVWL